MQKSNFLKSERNRLSLKQTDLLGSVGVNKGTIVRWEAGGSIPSDKLTLLSLLGFDVQFIVTGVRSKNLNEISSTSQLTQFEFEGTLSPIVKVLEEVLIELKLKLPPKAKGQVIETLLMQSLLKHQIPTKEDIYPILKLVA